MSRLYVSCGQIRKEIPTGRPRLMRSVGLSGQARLDAGENVVLIDLLRFEDDPQDLMAIPGALRADPGKVRHRTRIVMPEGMDLVLYCESKNSFVSARVATALRKKGVRQIRVLVGGLTAWKARGFPLDTVTTELAERIAEMKRLGIELIPSPWSPPPAEATPASD
jgi:rhodanese-related sulfurtransferase